MIAKTFVWKKDTMVLRKMDAAKIPSYEELMMMGAVGLILKEILFDIEGDAFYIDKNLRKHF